MANFLKSLICWLFGQCYDVQAQHVEMQALGVRMDRIEQRQDRHERLWRPRDTFG